MHRRLWVCINTLGFVVIPYLLHADLLNGFPLKDPEYVFKDIYMHTCIFYIIYTFVSFRLETQSTAYEHNINTLIAPLLQTCEPQNKLIKPTLAVIQV